MFSLVSSIALTNIIYLILGKLFSKKKINNIKNFSEIAINGFIYLSFIALLVNFFYPLNLKINTLICIIIFFFFFLKKKLFSQKEFVILILISLFGFFFIIFDTIYRPDAGLYHLPFTKILNNEKIIFGLANLHSRFGHISIIQYSSAINNNFILGDVGIIIPLLSIYSFLTFYFLGDILNFLLSKKKINMNFYSIFFSSLVVLYIAWKINRYGEFGNDAIGHLLFFYLISKLINYKKVNYQNFNKIYLISVFAVLNKFMLVFSLIIPAYVFFKDKISIKRVIFSLPTIFIFLWILRNIITSSCAVYPQMKTCFTDLKWSNKKEIITLNKYSEAWAKDWPNRFDKKLSVDEYNKNFNWLYTWKENHFKKIIKIILPYLIILILIYLYFKFRIKKKDSFNFNLYNFKLPLFVSFIGLIFFFLKFPLYRYGFSYLISFLILSLTYFIKFYDYNKIKKVSIFVIFIFFMSLTFKQINRYTQFYETRNLVPKIYNDKKQHRTIKLNNEGDFFNLSLNGSCMYDANLCAITKKDQLTLNKKYSYKFLNIK
jgi:hypothetical protein